MNRYETFVIFETDLAAEGRQEILNRIESLISADKGVLLVFDEWGSRKLAYPIQKKNQGYYIRTDYCGSGSVVESIERILRQNQHVLRYMTILLETDANPEALKAEMVKPEEETKPEEVATAEEESASEEVTAPEEESPQTEQPAEDETVTTEETASEDESVDKE